MTICLTPTCKKCREKFLATFDEDGDPQEYCDSCRGESACDLVADSKTFDPMNPPGTSEFPTWDPSGKEEFHGPTSE
jgi:hypothetical protein